MADQNKPVPGPAKANDGISILPGRALIPQTNWPALKREFLLAPDYTSPRLWLHEVKMWPREKVLNGNTVKRVLGWGNDKARLEQRRTEAAIEQMLEEQRKRMPDLIKAKLNLVVKIIADVGKWDRLQPAEKKLCFEILKTELGEPSSIKTMGLVTPKDPVESLLEEYGLMKEGRIIIDAEPPKSPSTDAPAAAIDSGPSAEVAQSPPL